MFLIGYDIGTSSIKASLMESQTQKALASATYPKTEMPISVPQPGRAEQNPADWWENLKKATAEIMKSSNIDKTKIEAIGITYQMHGLVCVDKDREVLRPSIIWCDSRAVETGNNAAEKLGRDFCLRNLLNYPGNFTASKLKWVMENEPDIYKRIYKIMLPGDYIAMKMSGQINTTVSGLSEGIFWDFTKNELSSELLDCFGFSEELLAEPVETFSVQGEMTKQAADEMGLCEGIKIAYRAGDQPNNAFSLNVLEPGEVAATAGTSGVIYAIADKPVYDDKSRVNTFVHVNHKTDQPRFGVLLCVNGTGILYSWLKKCFSTESESYEHLNHLADMSPVGSDGLTVLPFGNGAERTLENRDIGASFSNINFNTHDRSHLIRAAQEGIVFALNSGLDIIQDMGSSVETIRAGKANMFLSMLFKEAFATVTNSTVELYDTDGSQGAARGAGIGSGIYKNAGEAFENFERLETIEPNEKLRPEYQQAYEKWQKELLKRLA